MQLEEWLALTAHGAPTQFAHSRVMAAAAGGGGSPLPQPAFLVSDRRESLLQQDAKVMQLFASRGAAAGLPAFEETPLSGATTLLDLARQDAHFDPWRARLDAPELNAYAQRLDECPMFQRTNDYKLQYDCKTSKLSDAMEQVGRCAPDGPTQEADPRARLKEMVQRGNGGNITGDFYFTSITEASNQIQAEIFVAHFEIKRVFGPFGFFMPCLFFGPVASRTMLWRFRTENWAQSAKAVAAAHYRSVADWLAIN
ncbi:MAG: hypothetical protein WDN46_00940 [Methylocella sp.]